MGRLTLPFVVMIVALTLTPPVPAGRSPAVDDPGKKSADETPPRQLSKADAEWSQKKYAEAVAFGRAGKFDEAQGPVREILDLCIRELGEDHFTTKDYRREIKALQKLAALPEASRAEYVKTYTLYDEMDGFRKKGRYADALRPAKGILDIYRRLLGPESTYVALAANQYALLLYEVERYAEGEKQLREALKIFRGVVGDDHPGTASLYGNLGLNLERQFQFAEARRLLEMSLKLTIRVRGEDHAETGVSYNNLAGHLDRQAHYGDAERLYSKAVEILRAAEGEDGSRLATTYGNHALTLQHLGNYDEAERLYQAALKIRRKFPGENHPDTGRVYMNLATNREAQGDIAEAELLHRKALDCFRESYGPDHFQTALALNNLGVNLDNQGRYAEAEPHLRRALAIVLRSPADQSLAVAKLSNNLASCLQGQDKYAEAEAQCTKALASLRDRLEADHPDVAVALNNVAATLDAQGRYAAAEKHLREALEITQRRNGKDHAETTVARGNLGVNLYHQGRFEEAERLFREALDAQRRVLGEGHPHTAQTYKNLVVNCCARGEHAKAVALAAAAAGSFESARRRVAFGGLDRAGRMAESSPFPALAAAAARGGKPDTAWQALEQNLARGLLDDLSARPLSAEDRRRERELLGRLDLLDRQVAALPAGGGADAEGRPADELRRQREAAQADFARFQADLATRYGVAAGEVYGLARIQAQLPADAALLAWVDLSDQDKRVDPKGDHWACLVRHRGDPVWVRLPGTGPDGKWTDEDERLAARARRAFASRPTDEAGPWKDLAGRLARQRLAPLEDHLKGGADLPAVRHLIVLPSHKMAAVPVEALTDKLTVSYAPSGTMLAWLKEQRAGREAPAASLLALGDPAFQRARDDGDPPKGAPPAKDRREAFARLPGTRQEVLGVARVFAKTQLLLGPEASDKSLDQLAASGGLRGFRYLHFATHGVLDAEHPLRSALILARERQAPDDAEPRDARLTAQRILRGWKLDADLVTLSACNTGLGRYAGGEGYLGFSQALFLVGARGLVLSLWQVDDAATALLMARFYENLLGTPEGTVKPMPRAEALAEAKRWLRGLGPDEVRELTKDLPARGTRGVVAPRKKPEGPADVRSYEHPYYWSGFILIGDPR
jgi:CHAT domain-containing protein/tetratricopeptide (TPR) repeat protein